MNEIEKYLNKIGLSDSETVVFMQMVKGVKSAHDLILKTKMKRPTVYYALNALEKRGLISKSGKKSDFGYVMSPLNRLIAIAREKENEAMYTTEKIAELVTNLTSISKFTPEKPQVSFFEGVDAVKHIVMDVMYTKNRHVDIIAPARKNFFWGVGEDFLRNYIEERKRRNITTRNLWEKEIEPENFQKYYSNLSKIRIVPKVMQNKFKTMIFIFDDKTLYVSSFENCYAFLVSSREHKETMEALFEGIWLSSKPHKE